MRIRAEEITLNRVFNAIKRRIIAVPSKFSWGFSKKSKNNRKSLQSFKDKHKGERCYLVANGPSLKNMDLSFLKNKISFGLNRIYIAYEDFGFVNDYLVCINRLVLSQFKEEINKLKMPKFLNWDSRKEYDNEKNDTYFIYKSFEGKSFGKDISRSMNPAATVTYAALQVIYYMGFSEVVIIGMDHNFTIKEKNRPNKTEIRHEEVDKNHFHPSYFPKGSKWETPDLVSSEYFYNIAKNVFENDNRRIIDCTVNGRCTVFEKGNIHNFI